MISPVTKAARSRYITASTDVAPGFPLPMGELHPLRAAAEQNGSTDFTPLWSGQAAALAREMPAKMLIDRIVQEATKFGGG